MKTGDEARLPEEAEAMLQDWPAPRRDDAHWEQAAQAVMREIDADPGETEGDELLGPPLPAGPDEEALEQPPAVAEAEPAGDATRKPAATRSRPPPQDTGPRLADLARARVRSADAAEEATRIAKESLSFIKEQKQTRPAAEAAPPEAAPSEAAPPEPTPEPGPAQVVDLGEARERRSTPARPIADDSRTGKMAAVALIAVGLAAGVAVYVTGRSQAPAPTGAVTVAAAPSALAPAGRATPTSRHEPPTDEAAARTARPGPAGEHETEERARSHQAVARAEGAEPHEGVEPAPIDLEPTKKGGPAGRADGPDDEQEEDLRPALNESLEMHPSAGAISSALAPVMGRARRCVVGHDRASKATVVFSSDGTVKSVTVTGPAAGTGAAACIRTALSAMRVERFARPTYTVRGVTIRP